MAAKTFEDFLITWCKFLVATSRYPKVELITKAFSPSDGKILGNNGKILTCWSTCMSGPSHCCNHVITCIYKIEHPNTHGYTDLSCTSTACAWNKSTIKVIEPKRIFDIVVRKRIESITASILSYLHALMTCLLRFIFTRKFKK